MKHSTLLVVEFPHVKYLPLRTLILRPTLLGIIFNGNAFFCNYQNYEVTNYLNDNVILYQKTTQFVLVHISQRNQ